METPGIKRAENQVFSGHNEVAATEGSDGTFVTALARGLAVMRAFGAGRPRMTLADAAKATGLTRATVRRSLLTLVELGYAENDGRYFSLTPRVLTIGYSYLSSMPLPRIAQPFLERVSETLNESCSLSILDGDEIVYVARAATRRIMSIGLSVGSRLPAFHTSMGRVLLAALPEAEMERRLPNMDRTPHTPFTRVTPEALREELARVRGQGYALMDQELELGLRSIAVPVLGPGGQVVAAMNIGTQAGRVDLDRLTGPILETLRATAQEVSAVPGGG